MRARLRTPLLVAAILVAAAPLPRSARAQAPPAAESYDDLKRRGDEAMIALRYGDALDLYRRAYEASRTPALLYNMGRAYEGLGDFPRALEALEEFAEKAPPELKARVPKLDQLLADVRRRVSTVVISCSVAGADIRLGDREVGKTRQGQVVLKVMAGKQRLRVTHDEFRTWEREVDLSSTKVETIDVPLRSKKTPVIRVLSPVDGAKVLVDGAAVGVVPAETAVEPGMHRVSLTADGFEPAETTVVVSGGEDKQVNVPMTAKEKITAKWWFWTAIGAAVVGGAATAFIVTREREPDTGTIPPGRVEAALRF